MHYFFVCNTHLSWGLNFLQIERLKTQTHFLLSKIKHSVSLFSTFHQLLMALLKKHAHTQRHDNKFNKRKSKSRRHCQPTIIDRFIKFSIMQLSPIPHETNWLTDWWSEWVTAVTIGDYTSPIVYALEDQSLTAIH